MLKGNTMRIIYLHSVIDCTLSFPLCKLLIVMGFCVDKGYKKQKEATLVEPPLNIY